MKTGPITKEIANLKKQHEEEEGVKQFFQVRDKRKRGAKGLVDDATSILEEESLEKERLYAESIKESPLDDHIIPMFNGIFLTARRNKVKTDSGLYLPTASFGAEGSTDLEIDFADTQKVISVGPQVQQACVGMEVKINLDNFRKRLESSLAQKLNKEFELKIPVEVINGVEYIKITERDISYISNSMGIKKEEE